MTPVTHKKRNSSTVFQKLVYLRCAEIPRGYFSTYKEVSRILCSSPRAVGGALKRNPFAPKVPCHRVIQSDYKIGGFLGESCVSGRALSKGKVLAKIQLLECEGLIFDVDGYLEASLRESRMYYYLK